MKNYKKGTPEAVLAIFRELCTIPHGSGNTKAISDYCVAFAKKLGLKVIQEPCNNVIIYKDATPGYEGRPAVMIQGHLDMVCEKTPECPIDMAKEGLDVRVDGDIMYAEGTTLGGDDGIAIASALALLESEDVPHPAIEAVFTVDEETSMVGAGELDASKLKSRIVLNMDSEEEGVLTVGCAGGCTAQITWTGKKTPAEGTVWRITVDGLCGGHSGVDINKGKANADMLLADVLSKLGALRLSSICGGTKGNAIPRTAEAVIVTNCPQVERIVTEAEKAYAEAYAATEPELQIHAEQVTQTVTAFDETLSEQIVNMLSTQPNGVQAMSKEIPGLVQTSLNLGILVSSETDVQAIVTFRSSVEAEKKALSEKIAGMATANGAEVMLSGDYPAWEYNPESRLREVMIRCYEELNGKKPKVELIHAGLECGILSAKLPGMDAVSFGPDLMDIHTTRERLSISSVARTWELVLRVLATL